MFGTRKHKAEGSSFRLDTIQEFLDAADAAVLLIAPDRRIGYMNRTAEAQWGKATGRYCYKALQRSNKPCGDCPIEEVLESKVLVKRAVRMPSRDGWTDRENLYMHVIGPVSGSPFMAVVSTDLPERRALEREVRRERQFSEALLQSVNALVIGLDQSGNISFVNKAAEQITGYTESEIKAGGGMRLLVPEEYQVLARDYFGSPPGEPRSTEAVLIPLVNKSGLRRMISWTYSPLHMDDGQAEGAIALGQDVTERFARRRQAEKLAEELLVVNAILSKAQSAVSLDQMLEGALSALLTLPGYRCGAAYMLDVGSNEAVLAAHRGFQKATPRGVVRWSPDVFPASALRSGRIEMSGAAGNMHPSLKDMIEIEELKGAVAIPLFIAGRPAAMLLLGHDLDRDKAEAGQDLLKAAAEALQLGAEKARLRQRAEERAREATALLSVAQNLTGTLELTSALARVAVDAAELLQVDRCNIWLFDEGKQELVPRAGHDWTSADSRPESIPLAAHGAAAEARRTLKPVMVFDAERDPRMPAAEVEKFGIKSSLVVPLVTDGRFTGTLTLDMTSHRRRFTDRDIELMESFARQASIAMQKASLVEELRQSEERYRVLADNSLIGLFVHDGVDILYANDRAFEMVGYERDDFHNLEEILQILSPDDRAHAGKLVQRFVSGAEPANIRLELKLRRKDGSHVVIETMSNYVNFEDRYAFMVTMVDNTQRVEAERALMASEQRYRALVETSTDSIIISGPDGSIKFANSASVQLTGIAADELIGRNIYSFVHPDERGEVVRDFARAWEMGRGVSRYPIRVLVHGGEKYFEATTSLLGEPGPDADVMVIVRDVTEREIAQRMIRESEERYRTIVETSRDLIMMANRAGEILYANPVVSDIFGLSQEEIRGKYFFEFISPEDRERASRDFINDWRTGSTIPNYPLKIQNRDGSTKEIEISSGLVGWPGEDAVQIFIVRDVTERKQREAERELQLRIDEAIASIAGRFVDPDDIYEAIRETVKEAGELLEASRGFFVELSEDLSTAVRVVEWCAPGERAIGEEIEGVAAADFEWWARELFSRKEVVYSEESELPRGARREVLRSLRPHAAAVVAVMVRDNLGGAIGFRRPGGHRKWTSHEITLLREISRTISRAVERKQWVEQLGRSERFRTRITESMGEGLLVLTDGVITWVNNQACEIYGYEAEEMIGRTPEFLLDHPGRLRDVAGEMLDALNVEGVYVTEGRARRKDGTLIDTLISVTSLGVTEEGAGELVTVVRDVTEAKQMQEVVTAAADAYSTLFSSAGDAMIVHTMDGDIREANERAMLYTGYTPEELRALKVQDLVSEKAGMLYGERRLELLRDGVTTFETNLLRKDGGRTPVEVTARKTNIWGETVILSACRDTTERHKAEAETRRRATQLASLNEIVKAATSSLDLETILDLILKVMIEVSGAEPGMIILRPHPARAEYMPRSSVGNIPEMKDLLDETGPREVVEEIIETLDSAVLIDTDMEVKSPRLARMVAVLRERGYSQILMVPLKSGETTAGMIALASDGGIDERDLGFYDAAGAEIGVAVENALIYRELTAEHERLSLLYRTAQGISGELELNALLVRTAEEAARSVGAGRALVALNDPTSKEFRWSASYNADLTSLAGANLSNDRGIGGRVVQSKRALILSADRDTDGLMESEPFAAALDMRYGAAVPLVSGDRVLGILMLLTGDEGKELTAEDVLLLEAIGRQAGVAIEKARLYEETRKHLEAVEKAHEELKALDRMKSDFVSTVSHELRSPLAVIEGFAKTMVEHFEQIDRDTERESLEIILKKSIALEGLIANILDMSRIEEGRLEVQAEEIELTELCEHVRDDQETVDESHDICLELQQRPIFVVADREKTEVALGNLVRNAVKFSPDGGRICITARVVDGMAEISVSDEGIGIPVEELDRVFDRFYQVDSGETRSFPGSGLGLYITRELVQAMGGEIKVDSEPGRGSVFSFTLPLA